MQEGEGLGPASTDKPDFVDSQREALPFMRSGWGWERGEVGRWGRGVRGNWG